MGSGVWSVGWDEELGVDGVWGVGRRWGVGCGWDVDGVWVVDGEQGVDGEWGGMGCGVWMECACVQAAGRGACRRLGVRVIRYVASLVARPFAQR